jgi:hypothetical protein
MSELSDYLKRQEEWSTRTFGHAVRTKGICQHIRKELLEIEAAPHDLIEWVDVIILAMDGYWRAGGDPLHLMDLLQMKQDRNFARRWPYPPPPEDQASEHIAEDPGTANASPAQPELGPAGGKQ